MGRVGLHHLGRALGRAVFAIAVLVGTAAQAATFTVTSTADAADFAPGDGSCAAIVGASVPCTLRAAIQEANAWGGEDAIVLSAETYVLTRANLGGEEDAALRGDLDISESVLLSGEPGATVIDGNGIDRVFDVQEVTGLNVRITGVEVRGGSAPAGGDGGGALRVGLLTQVVIDASTLRDNLADEGGAIWNEGGTLRIEDSTLSGNHAGACGAVRSFLFTAELEMQNTTLSGNEATSLADGDGGALCVLAGSAMLRNVTIHDNAAERSGGGVIVTNGFLEIVSTLIAGNRASFGPDVLSYAETGTVLSAGGNLIGDGTFSTLVPGVDQVGTEASPIDPRVTPLGDYGGATATHALRVASAAIDRGNTSGCPDADQRGVARPYDGDEDGIAACDVGAVEYVPEADGAVAALLAWLGLAARAARGRRAHSSVARSEASNRHEETKENA